MRSSKKTKGEGAYHDKDKETDVQKRIYETLKSMSRPGKRNVTKTFHSCPRRFLPRKEKINKIDGSKNLRFANDTVLIGNRNCIAFQIQLTLK